MHWDWSLKQSPLYFIYRQTEREVHLQALMTQLNDISEEIFHNVWLCIVAIALLVFSYVCLPELFHMKFILHLMSSSYLEARQAKSPFSYSTLSQTLPTQWRTVVLKSIKCLRYIHWYVIIVSSLLTLWSEDRSSRRSTESLQHFCIASVLSISWIQHLQ